MPFVIGGTGGSGTRLVAQCLRLAGADIGQKLNPQCDALSFVPLLEEAIPEILSQTRGCRYQPEDLPLKLQQTLSTDIRRHVSCFMQQVDTNRHWGWKNPRSLYLWPLLARLYPELKFIHVIRDGRNMALSSNTNQLRKYYALLHQQDSGGTAQRAARLWNTVNTGIHHWAQQHIPERYTHVRYEDICAGPLRETSLLAAWLGLPPQPGLACPDTRMPEAKWHGLDAATRQQLQDICQPGLTLFGYLKAA